MKSLKKLIIPAVILVAAIAVLLIAKGIAKREEQNTPEDTGASEPISLVEFSSDIVSRVSYVSEKGEVSVDKDGDSYYLTSDRAFPLDQTVGASLVSDALGLKAKGSISPTGTTEEYGLENPSKSVVITLKNGGKTTVAIGDFNPYSDVWYARIDGGGAIYLLETDITECFEMSLDDMIKNETFTAPPSGLSSVGTVTLEYEDRTVVYTRVPGTDAVTDEDGNVIEEAVPDGFTKQVGDGEPDASEEASAEGSGVYGEMTGIKLDRWYAYGVEGEALAEYGLDPENLFCRATIAYTEQVTTSSGESSSTVT
ncbi:MAG: DUF4340 domain-containing protein, partial [Clostridia bacterium]|nr:DUF4340 domain-containing protein [Clostridia bacterium]